MPDPLRQILQDMANDMTWREVMQKHLLAQRQFIQERTQEWKDVYGRVFADYSEGHRKRRVDLNLAVRPMGKGTDSMLVMDSYDGMMASIDDRINGNTGELFFNDNAKRQIAKFHNVLGVGKKKVKREFWGISKEEEEWHAENWEKELNEVLGNLIAKYSDTITLEDLNGVN